MHSRSGADATTRQAESTARDADVPGDRRRRSAAVDPTPEDGRESGAVERSRAHVRRRRLRRIERSETFRSITERIAFDALSIVKPTAHGRYADAIRVKATSAGESLGVALGLLDRPDEDGERADGYADAVADCLARWHGASDAEGVVTVHDWACEPRPWVATAPADATLSEWDAPDAATRLRNAVHLTDALAGLHHRGVVHAGIDPGNVVFPADTLAERPLPCLDNVGLMHALRKYFEPSNYLDPRYAAPEYYDDGFGGVDAATDVYQLGAVVYRLCTDRAPFRGTYDEVRTGVLERDPDPPTDHNASLPNPIDAVLAKAMAKRKLCRYESAAQFRADLERVCERSGYRIDA